jgi:hypothetical protein
MNKIHKVIYSKVRNCYVVVSELAKNHSRGTKAEHTARKGTALTAALLLALSCVSVLGAPGAEAKTKTRTDGSNFIGVERTDGTFEDSSYKNYNGGGAEGPQSITIGTAAEAGNSTITIGDRRAGASIGSVYVGQGDIKNPFTDRGGWVTSVGYNSDATGYGSIAIGSNAIAQNDIKQNIELSNASGDLNDNPTIKGASVALGYSASAADGSIAIGSYSEATAAASTATAKFRDTTDSDYKAPSSYVSVGSDTVKRRITNVAAGSDANDVATVGQLAYVEQEAKAKGSWKLRAGNTNESTVTAGSTVDLSAADKNLSISKDKDSNNVIFGLAKDLTGITSISNQTTSGTTTTGAKIELGTNGKTTISGGDVDVSSNKITSLGSGLTGSKYDATTDANHAANLSDVNSMITTAFKDDTIKANADASNIGANINHGKHDLASGVLQSASELAWAQALGSGKIADDTGSEEESKRNGSLKLVTGGTVYTELKKGLLPSSTSTQTVVFSDYKTGENLKNLDETTVKYDYDRAGSNIHTLTPDYSTITLWGIDRSDPDKYHKDKDYGTAILNLRSALIDKDGNALKDAGGNKVTIATATGDTLKNAVNLGDLQTVYNLDARVDASNIGVNLTYKPDGTDVTDDDKRANENLWGQAIGMGKIADSQATDASSNGSQQLVTGGTVYSEVRPSKDGNYVLKTNTTGANLLALDKQVKTNTDKLSDVDSRSVKYDTKTENGKTVVDNTKITLAGDGGTTITNLKDGVNDSDAATVGQLNNKIAGVTYTYGDGLKVDGKTVSVKAGNGITVDTNGVSVNTGKHLNINGGKVDVDDSGAVADGDGNLVTGGTVYKALHDGGLNKLIIGTPGTPGKDGTPGTIGLVGPAGANGKDGAVDITIQKGEDGKDGTKGANGVDGKDGINRIVYEDKNGKHQVATLEDGLKFAGDDGQASADKVIAKKLNNTLDIIGGAKGKLTDNNIGVNNVGGKLKIQLAQDLTGITSLSGSTDDKGAKITLDTTDKNISVNGGKITGVASGLSTSDGSYDATDAGNAANISDVNKMISKAVTDAKTDTQKDLDGKANVDASNIGTNLKGADGKTAATEAEQKANLDKWGEAIGTGKVENGSQQLVTGETVYNAVKDKADKSYVDDQLKTKANTDGSNIDADKFSMKVAVGEVNATDERAVSGKTVQKAIDGINSDMTTKLDGKANVTLDNITPAGINVIKDQARGAVTIDNKGLNTKVVATQDETNHTTTYTINVEGNGKVADKDTGLISGSTLYNEVRPASDGSYIKTTSTTAQNLSSLDTQVKKNSDLVNSDGSTIKIGSKDSATKVDISDKNGSGRVVTGVVTDTNDANSAANVGYVNNMAAANTQQIYRDMNNAYGRLDNNINRAAAGSNALAALHPLEYDPDDKLSFAMGYGHYHNANAAAVGAFYHPNSKTQFNFGVALGNGDPGFNAGIAFKLGKPSPYAGMNRVTLIHTVQDLKASDEAKDKRIDALEKENQEMKKQLQAIMAKLNG